MRRAGSSQRQLSDVPQLHVTCCETFYISNLSAQPVTLLPVEAQGPVHQATVCSPGVTAPISVVWAGGNTAAAAAPAAAGKAAAAAEHADAQSSAATAPQQVPAAMWPCRVAVQLSADETGGIDGASGGNGNGSVIAGIDDVPTISLAEPCQRRWLVVRNGHSTAQQLAYRLLRSNGRHHLVLYVDEQPPLRVVSTASVYLEVGLTTPQHQGCDCRIAGVCRCTRAMICMPHITCVKTYWSLLLGHGLAQNGALHISRERVTGLRPGSWPAGGL